MSRLLIGIPSKGRLQEATSAFFARAGLSIQRERGERYYRGILAGFPKAEVLFLSASDIATEIASGGLHLGVTGEDLVREHVPDPDNRLVQLTPLGFGRADVVVAVPQAWIDVTTMDDLEDVASEIHARQGHRMRIATKYVRLTRQFFARREVTNYRIVESSNATEGAPLSGAAEAIVDITTTGATLAANGLKVLEDGVVLRSQAGLFGSKAANWSENVRAFARTVLGRIAAEERARLVKEMRVAGLPSPEAAILELSQEFPCEAPFGPGDPLVLHVQAGLAADVADRCVALGASTVVVASADYIFSEQNTMLDRLAQLQDDASGSRPRHSAPTALMPPREAIHDSEAS